MESRKKMCLSVGALIILNVVIILLFQHALAVAYKQGSAGSTVKEIQQKLTDFGYYGYNIDGIYGSRTVTAVKKFQGNNGLTADGVCGSKTLNALGISSASTNSNDVNVNLLARLISAEARGEPYVGQVAVGAVVLNRIEHPSFPNTLSGVIYQSGAFTCVSDGQFNQPVADSAYRAAKDAINGWDPSNGAIYYFNPSTATSQWIWSRPLLCIIGKHRFCS